MPEGYRHIRAAHEYKGDILSHGCVGKDNDIRGQRELKLLTRDAVASLRGKRLTPRAVPSCLIVPPTLLHSFIRYGIL